MKRNTFYFIFLVLLAPTAIPAVAEDANIIMPMDSRAPTQSYRGLGTVDSVNVKTGRISLNQQPISGLGWKAMTASYNVQDKALLANLKKGQKVEFSLVEARKGQYEISAITAVR